LRSLRFFVSRIVFNTFPTAPPPHALPQASSLHSSLLPVAPSRTQHATNLSKAQGGTAPAVPRVRAFSPRHTTAKLSSDL